MSGNRRITEIDLLAYADGLLDTDTQRKAEVEAYLERRPEDAARVKAYLRQNAEIRQAYAASMQSSVPERLYAALYGAPGRGLGAFAKTAALIGLALFAGYAGWLIGREDRTAERHARAFVQQTIAAHVSADRPGQDARLAQGQVPQPIHTLSGEVPFEVRLPDLSAHGYAITDKRVIGAEGRQVLEVSYVRQGGDRVSLFVRTRWRDDSREIRVEHDDAAAVAYWTEGPFMYGLAANLDRTELHTLAVSARGSLASPQTAPARGNEDDTLAAGAVELHPITEQQTTLTQPEHPPALAPVRSNDL